MANQSTKKDEKKKDEKKGKGKIVAGIIFSIIGGFSFGVVATLGGIFGAGYYLLAGTSVKDGVDNIEKMTGQQIDYTQVITEDLANNSVVGIIQELAGLVQEAQNNEFSLSSLERFTPLIRNTVEDNLLPMLEKYGIPVSINELMNTPFADLGDYIAESINQMEIGKALSSFSGGGAMEGMMLLLAYGEENYEYVEKSTADGTEIVMLGNNKPVVVGDLMESDLLNEALSHISLAAFLKAMDSSQLDDPLMAAILYGEEGVDHDVVGGDIVMRPKTYVLDSNVFTDTESEITYAYNTTAQAWYNAQTGHAIVAGQNGYDYVVVDNNSQIVECLQISTENVYNVYRFPANGNLSPTDAVLQRRRGLTVGEMMKNGIDTDIIMSIKIADIIGDVDPDVDPMMYAIASKGWTVGDINTENINTLTLGEIMPTTDTTSILYILRNEPIGELEDAFSTLTVRNILGEGVMANRFLKHLADVAIADIETAMNDLKIVDIFSDKVYVAGTTTLTGTWKYMLTDPNGVKSPNDYTLNDLDSLINNLCVSIKTATLGELKEDGVLNLTNVDTDQSTIMGQSILTLMQTLVDVNSTQSTLGELSIQDLLSIVSSSK